MILDFWIHFNAYFFPRSSSTRYTFPCCPYPIFVLTIKLSTSRLLIYEVRLLESSSNRFFEVKELNIVYSFFPKSA